MSSFGAAPPEVVDVAAEVAAIPFGAISSYVFGYRYGSGVLDGNTYAGSTIEPAGNMSTSSWSDDAHTSVLGLKGGMSLSGTWLACGRVNSIPASSYSRITLFKRIF